MIIWRCLLALTFGELRETPLGVISFVSSDLGIQQVKYCTLRVLKQVLKIGETQPSLNGLQTLGTFLGELNEFLNKRRKTFSVSIDWSKITGFQRDVLAFIVGIPYGGIFTYGEVAQQLGRPGGARAVGNALHSNPMQILIPCHRIVGSNGELRGYQGGIEAKVYLLRMEGHQIDGNRIIMNKDDPK